VKIFERLKICQNVMFERLWSLFKGVVRFMLLLINELRLFGVAPTGFLSGCLFLSVPSLK
jgi:hypothetical protein